MIGRSYSGAPNSATAGAQPETHHHGNVMISTTSTGAKRGGSHFGCHVRVRLGVGQEVVHGKLGVTTRAALHDALEQLDHFPD
ncbi:hypothetical protein ACFC5T_09540 [Streptomyces sp. NPDC055961]|uniref:hypothetical protein n=2 Tax=Streptomyces TaxID=1883 RepID=UPI0035DA6D65